MTPKQNPFHSLLSSRALPKSPGLSSPASQGRMHLLTATPLRMNSPSTHLKRVLQIHKSQMGCEREGTYQRPTRRHCYNHGRAEASGLVRWCHHCHRSRDRCIASLREDHIAHCSSCKVPRVPLAERWGVSRLTPWTAQGPGGEWK